MFPYENIYCNLEHFFCWWRWLKCVNQTKHLNVQTKWQQSALHSNENMPWNYYNEWKQQQQQQTQRLKKELFQRVSTRFNVFENENKGKKTFLCFLENQKKCALHTYSNIYWKKYLHFKKARELKKRNI